MLPLETHVSEVYRKTPKAYPLYRSVWRPRFDASTLVPKLEKVSYTKVHVSRWLILQIIPWYSCFFWSNHQNQFFKRYNRFVPFPRAGGAPGPGGGRQGSAVLRHHPLLLLRRHPFRSDRPRAPRRPRSTPCEPGRSYFVSLF